MYLLLNPAYGNKVYGSNKKITNIKRTLFLCMLQNVYQNNLIRETCQSESWIRIFYYAIKLVNSPKYVKPLFSNFADFT